MTDIRTTRRTSPRTFSTGYYGRIVVTDPRPLVDGGTFAAKAIPGENVPVGATVFREGHDLIGADAVLFDSSGNEVERARLTEHIPGTDRFTGHVVPPRRGLHHVIIEGWADPYRTWAHDAALKVPAGVDVDLMLAEGIVQLDRALAVAGRREPDLDVLRRAKDVLNSTDLDAAARLAPAIGTDVDAVIDRLPVRDLVSASRPLPVNVDRPIAGNAAWYEFFPRSEGAHYDRARNTWTSGTLSAAAGRLDAIAAMGFDVAYLPPIHPIGTVNRKGKNNALDALPGDPGSPWAIGSADGGHDAIHPDLGDFGDFDAFVARARELGLEVALDLALQAAPDHPWVTDHPEWFTTQVDGTIRYAENPPKKYQDIYPLDFDNDYEGLCREVERIVEVWIAHGVTIFRVDNPHTKPVAFWEWLLARMHEKHPDVVFLAEAFTRPPMMHALAKVGFQQSYSYFTWRNTKEELEEYFTELRDESGDFLRPNFFCNTPDILTEYLQYGGPAAFKIRAVLAAIGSPLWGVYSGYELCEHVARPGSEEYLDNEKYEYRPRDFAQAEADGRSLAGFLTELNRIRHVHPATGELRNIRLQTAEDDAVLAFSKRKGDDVLIVVVNLDPHGTRETMVDIDLPSIGLAPGGEFRATDLITGRSWQWGERNFVRLDPHHEPAHIIAASPTEPGR